MNIESARYFLDQGYPVLEIKIDGHLAHVFEIKKIWVDLGYIPLLSAGDDFDWKAYLKPIEIKNSNKPDLDGKVLQGFTDDKRVVALARGFWDAINEENGKIFKEGPVSIPQA